MSQVREGEREKDFSQIMHKFEYITNAPYADTNIDCAIKEMTIYIKDTNCLGSFEKLDLLTHA